MKKITINIDEKLKEAFSKLCEEEGIDMAQGLRELMIEAIKRGYIIKQRKLGAEKVKGDAS
jgi:antitoxin component of RelBE/YafQ-DinJ toxin-antitoxin module